MFRLAVRTIRSKFSLFMGTFLILTAGMTLLVANGNIIAATFQPAPHNDDIGRYDSATAIIKASQLLEPTQTTDQDPVYLDDTRGLPSNLTALIEQVGGVELAVPTRMFTAQILNNDGGILESDNTPIGHGWSTTLLNNWHILEGSEPQASNQVALSQDLANLAGVTLNDFITIITPQTTIAATVSAILTVNNSGGITGENSIFFTDNMAAELSGRPHIADAIGVIKTQGFDEQQLVTNLKETAFNSDVPIKIYHGEDKGGYVARQLYQAATSEVLEMMAVIAGIASFICIFVIASTSTLSITQRLREIALLRLIGSTPRQIRRMLLAESLSITLLAGAVGSVLGLFVGQWFAKLLVNFGIAPVGFSAPFSAIVVPIAVVILGFVVLMGVYISARRASKIHAIEALRDASAEQSVMTLSRWLFGLGFIAFAALLAALIPRLHTEGGLVMSFLIAPIFVIALALLSPIFMKPCVSLVSFFIVRLLPIVGMLSRANLQTALRRTTSTAAPILVTIATVVSLISVTSVMEATSKADISNRVTADLIVKPVAAGMPLDIGQSVEAIPGVYSAIALSETVVYDATDVASGVIQAGLVQPNALLSSFDIDIRHGSVDDLAQNAMLVSQEVADMRNWHFGQVVPIYMQDGTRHDMRVAVIAATTVGLPNILLSFDYAVPHIYDPAVQAVYVKADKNKDTQELLSKIQQVARVNGGTVQFTADWLQEAGSQTEQASTAVMALLFGLTFVFTIIAISNTTIMAISNRGPDIRTLYRLGMRKIHILAMLVTETCIILLSAVVIGIIAVIPGIIGAHYTLLRMYDSVVLSLPLLLVAALIGVYVLVSVVASAIAGARIIRKM